MLDHEKINQLGAHPGVVEGEGAQSIFSMKLPGSKHENVNENIFLGRAAG